MSETEKIVPVGQPRIVLPLCECGAKMVMSRGGYPICEKTAHTMQLRYGESVIAPRLVKCRTCAGTGKWMEDTDCPDCTPSPQNAKCPSTGATE